MNLIMDLATGQPTDMDMLTEHDVWRANSRGNVGWGEIICCVSWSVC